MKKYISILFFVIIFVSLTACNTTEIDYEKTNFVAEAPQKTPNYKIEKISLNEAAESSGYSISDSKFRISGMYIENNYIVLSINYSSYNSTDCCAYNVMYDLDGNMIANVSNIALDEGCDKSGKINGIYGDFTVLRLSPAALQDKYALYNLKTKEIEYLQYDTASLKNNVIIVGNEDPKTDSYKYGALDLDLNEIVPVEYEELRLASPELLIAEKGKKYGIIDFNNNVIADFKYKTIQSFIGIDDSKSSNPISFLDYEKSINKYAVAFNKKDKSVLLDKKGNELPIDLDWSIDWDLEYGRTISQYEDKIYIKHNGRTISDLDGNVLTENVAGIMGGGYINGFCVIYDEDNENCILIDNSGNTVYQESTNSKKYNTTIYPVDQNGLFVVNHNYTNSNKQIYKIMDLSNNEVYLCKENEYIEPLGKGFFIKPNGNNVELLKITTNN